MSERILPKCFLHYRDDLNGCVLSQISCQVCRICKDATFQVMRMIQDARIEEREKVLRECLHLAKDIKIAMEGAQG